jgi:lysyl-tRNA synthetase class 2
VFKQQSLFIQEYMKLRSSAISALKKSGTDPYPHKFCLTMSLPEFIERYGSLEDGESHANVVSVAGEYKHDKLLVLS